MPERTHHDDTLGVLEHGRNGWTGRHALGGRGLDLLIRDPVDDDRAVEPRTTALARLKAAMREFDGLFGRSVAAVDAARTERLDWRGGLPANGWSAIELCVDADDRLWLSLHEGKSEDDSVWLVGFDPLDRPAEIRRARHAPDDAPPGERGSAV